MNARARLTEMDLMEKLAMLETDESEQNQLQKSASVSDAHADLVAFAKKAAALIPAARRAGEARARAELLAARGR